jgi:hypothetical protein
LFWKIKCDFLTNMTQVVDTRVQSPQLLVEISKVYQNLKCKVFCRHVFDFRRKGVGNPNFDSVVRKVSPRIINKSWTQILPKYLF